VLFVRGVGSVSYLWRHVIDQLAGQRRCVAFDLPLHGRIPAAADQDFSLPGLARFLVDCCEALELTDIDLVANDTGGAIAQAFATGRPEWLHTLTLTNCEAHDNVPPKALLPAVLLARLGLLARIGPRFVRDIPLTSLHARDLLAIEPALARLQVPTLIVWGTGDTAFHRKWAYWLRDTIPGATDVIEIDGARLFFPDERATEFTAALRRHWDNHP
jgi:pimeloyl-ACP methyl ester carboxylesterase